MGHQLHVESPAQALRPGAINSIKIILVQLIDSQFIVMSQLISTSIHIVIMKKSLWDSAIHYELRKEVCIGYD